MLTILLFSFVVFIIKLLNDNRNWFDQTAYGDHKRDVHNRVTIVMFIVMCIMVVFYLLLFPVGL